MALKRYSSVGRLTIMDYADLMISCLQHLSMLAHNCAVWYRKGRHKHSLDSKDTTIYQCKPEMEPPQIEEPNIKLCCSPDAITPQRKIGTQSPPSAGDMDYSRHSITIRKSSSDYRSEEIQRQHWGEAQPQFVPLDMIRDRQVTTVPSRASAMVAAA